MNNITPEKYASYARKGAGCFFLAFVKVPAALLSVCMVFYGISKFFRIEDDSSFLHRVLPLVCVAIICFLAVFIIEKLEKSANDAGGNDSDKQAEALFRRVTDLLAFGFLLICGIVGFVSGLKLLKIALERIF